MPKDYRFHHIRPEDLHRGSQHFSIDPADLLRKIREGGKLWDQGDIDAAAGNHTFTNTADGITMQELTARPKPQRRKVPTVEIYAVQSADKRHACVQVLVPNVFGNLEPLLDGETGQPVDFYEDFGDPRRWTKNMGPAIEAAARTAAVTCAKLMAKRIPT